MSNVKYREARQLYLSLMLRLLANFTFVLLLIIQMFSVREYCIDQWIKQIALNTPTSQNEEKEEDEDDTDEDSSGGTMSLIKKLMIRQTIELSPEDLSIAQPKVLVVILYAEYGVIFPNILACEVQTPPPNKAV
jgi:hypothetical protein